MRLLFIPFHDLERRHRSVETLECQLADPARLRQFVDRSEDALADQNLACLRRVAEAGCQVRHAADRGIVVTPFEADLAEGRVAHRNSDPKSQRMTTLAPSVRQTRNGFAHVDRHANGPLRVVGAGDGIVEQDQYAVAGEAFQPLSNRAAANAERFNTLVA